MSSRQYTARSAGAGHWILLAVLGLFCAPALASGLQVSPVSLTLHQGERAAGLTLSNTGTAALTAQVRVYRWTENQGGERLDPTLDLVASPPMLTLAPGASQLVRVVRMDAPPASGEVAYRLAVDELPLPESARPAQGLRFVLHYSLPVFVESTPAPTAAQPVIQPVLAWSVLHQGTRLFLQATNQGAIHAQVVAPVFITAAGQRITLGAGLFGYVLPGATMRWPLARTSPLAQPGSIEATVNGSQTTQPVALAPRVP